MQKLCSNILLKIHMLTLLLQLNTLRKSVQWKAGWFEIIQPKVRNSNPQHNYTVYQDPHSLGHQKVLTYRPAISKQFNSKLPTFKNKINGSKYKT